ncbi:MAG: glycosyltransferase, partial [Desulfobacterales bacterium]|nr:glycosyltransferase [Desulfobacterales bacterium]
SRVKRTCKRLRCLIIGDGPLMPELKERISGHGLGDTVILAGFRSDAARLVQLLDIFCLVSFSEGTSMALLEAMAAEVPAIVTDVGGNPEIVVPDKTGWVIPSDDPDAFAEALMAAVSEPDQQEQRGRAAGKRYEAMFSFEAMIDQYHHLYRRILAGD